VLSANDASPPHPLDMHPQEFFDGRPFLVNPGLPHFDFIVAPDPRHETRSEARRRYLGRFDTSWEAAAAATPAAELPTSGRKRNRKRAESDRDLTWLVKYQCDGCTYDEIAKAAKVDLKAVANAVRAAADELGIPCALAVVHAALHREYPAERIKVTRRTSLHVNLYRATIHLPLSWLGARLPTRNALLSVVAPGGWIQAKHS
jgi:hypothetical protein